MADNILRLRVDSQEYDAKLKKAAEGIRHLAEVAHRGGGELTGLEKAELDYVKALGSMETKSRTAAGSVRELENTFKELTVVYNQLNDVEKQDEGGKALAASLDQLKQRAQAARAELDNASKALGEQKEAGQQTGGMLDGLADKFGLSITKVMGFGTALAAGKMALDVAKDAFMSSETNVDDWGRTVRSAEGIYQSFVQSLNTGDFTSFLSNIGRVTQAAQEAYNALDELGTRMTIINPERARLQARQQELRADIRRNGADSEVGRAALAELKKIEPLLSKSFKTESQMNYTAFEKLVRERLAEGGINLNQKSFQQFMKTFSSDAAFQNLRKNARGSSELRETSEIGKFKEVDTRNIEQKLLDLFTDEWRQANSGYLTASFSAQGAAASNALGNARYMRVGSGGGKGGKGGKTGTTDIQFADDSIMAQEKLISDLTQKWKTASGELREGYLKDLEDAQKKLAEMTGKAKGDGAPTFTMAQLEGMSFDNQMLTIRGNRGRAQDKLDLATAAFATGGISNIDFSTYISGIKSALQDADLGDELYTSMTEKLKDATTVSTLLQEMMERGLAGADLESTAQALKEKLLSPEGIDQTAIQSFLEELNKQIEEAGGVGLKLNADTGEVTDDKENGKDDGKELKKFNDGIGKLSGGLSQVTGGLKAVGVEIPEEVDQVIGVINGVSQIISGVGTIISVFQTSAIVANTVALGVLTSAVTANTFAKFIPFFSGGGVVPAFAQGGTIPKFADSGLIGRAALGMMIPGNSMSGDNLRLPVDGGRGMIGVNSGELILNRAQQGNLASQLEGGGIGNLHLETIISGEDIRVVMKNNGRRTGRGEYLTSRNSRS